MPIAIYTVITGSYDAIKQPLVEMPGVDCYLFTNNPTIQDAGVWNTVGDVLGKAGKVG